MTSSVTQEQFNADPTECAQQLIQEVITPFLRSDDQQETLMRMARAGQGCILLGAFMTATAATIDPEVMQAEVTEFMRRIQVIANQRRKELEDRMKKDKKGRIIQ